MASDQQPGWEGLPVCGMTVHLRLVVHCFLDVTGGKVVVMNPPFLDVTVGLLLLQSYQGVEVHDFLENLETVIS